MSEALSTDEEKGEEVLEKREETLAEKVEKVRQFTEAGQLFLQETPDLRAREKARKRTFRSDPWSAKLAKDVRSIGGNEPILKSTDGTISQEDAQRSSYFVNSCDQNPGPLSKFGDGDGSFFDSWLTNTRFEAPDSALEEATGQHKLQMLALEERLKAATASVEVRRRRSRIDMASSGTIGGDAGDPRAQRRTQLSSASQPESGKGSDGSFPHHQSFQSHHKKTAMKTQEQRQQYYDKFHADAKAALRTFDNHRAAAKKTLEDKAFPFVGGDPFQRPSLEVPCVGLKQWVMPPSDLLLLASSSSSSSSSSAASSSTRPTHSTSSPSVQIGRKWLGSGSLRAAGGEVVSTLDETSDGSRLLPPPPRVCAQCGAQGEVQKRDMWHRVPPRCQCRDD